MLLAITVLLLTFTTNGYAGKETPAAEESTKKAAVETVAPQTYRIAIFEFEANEPKLSRNIRNLIEAVLNRNPILETIERKDIDKTFEELALSKSGLVSEISQIQTGAMVGAEFLITGDAFIMDNKLYITAKIINTATTRSKTLMAEGDISSALGATIGKLTDEMNAWFTNEAAKFLPAPEGRDLAIKWLTRKSQGMDLPAISVNFKETHMSKLIPDPPGYTEVIYILNAMGFTVYEPLNKDELASWAEKLGADKKKMNKDGLPDEVEIIIIGEAVSEVGIRRKDLVTVVARAEMRAIDRKTRKVLAVSRSEKEVREVDVSEMAAAKRATLLAARRNMVDLMPALLDRLSKN